MSSTEETRREETASRECIGLIGLGLMGLAIAERLHGGGFEVCGWDISFAQRTALENIGGQSAADAGDVFKRCERVILSLPDDTVVSSVLRESSAALRAGQVIIDSSTGSSEAAEALGRRLESLG